MYTDINFKTKKALKEAVAAGKNVTVFQPGGFFDHQKEGDITIEGPHGYHRWYAQATIKNGVVLTVK